MGIISLKNGVALNLSLQKRMVLQLSVLYTINNLKFKSFHTQCRSIRRIGPHNIDIISIIFGLLLGNCTAINISGEGLKITIKKSIIHKEYIFSIYEYFLLRGYCKNNKPRENIIILKEINKIYSRYELKTFTFRSFM